MTPGAFYVSSDRTVPQVGKGTNADELAANATELLSSPRDRSRTPWKRLRIARLGLDHVSEDGILPELGRVPRPETRSIAVKTKEWQRAMELVALRTWWGSVRISCP